jgi:hypothetical protein
MDFFDGAYQVVVRLFFFFGHRLVAHTIYDDESCRLAGLTLRFPALPRGSRLETGTNANTLTHGLVPESRMISRSSLETAKERAMDSG